MLITQNNTVQQWLPGRRTWKSTGQHDKGPSNEHTATLPLSTAASRTVAANSPRAGEKRALTPGVTVKPGRTSRVAPPSNLPVHEAEGVDVGTLEGVKVLHVDALIKDLRSHVPGAATNSHAWNTGTAACTSAST